MRPVQTETTKINIFAFITILHCQWLSGLVACPPLWWFIVWGTILETSPIKERTEKNNTSLTKFSDFMQYKKHYLN